MAWKGLHAGIDGSAGMGWWKKRVGVAGGRDLPEGLSMSCLEPVPSIGITV